MLLIEWVRTIASDWKPEDVPSCAAAVPAICGPQSDIPVNLFKLECAFLIKSPTEPSTAFSRPAKIGCLWMWGGVHGWNDPLFSNSLLTVEEIVQPLVDSLFFTRMALPDDVRAEGMVDQEVK